MCILLYLSDTRNFRHGEEYGSAKWGSAFLTNLKYASMHYYNNKLLTSSVRIGWNGYRHHRNLNTIVIGGSGAGKSQGYAIPNLLQGSVPAMVKLQNFWIRVSNVFRRCLKVPEKEMLPLSPKGAASFIVTDPKGELLRCCGTFLETCGYKIRVLDFVEIWKSHGYNPFRYIRRDDDVLKLADVIFKNTTPKDQKTSDPFWEDSAKIMLESLMLYLYHEAPPDEQNFSMVMEMIRYGRVQEDSRGNRIPSTLDICFERLEMQNPDHIAVKFYKDCNAGAADTIRSIHATLISHLAKFNMESLKKMTNKDEMELEKVGEEKTAIFMILPENDTSYNFLAGMLYTQAFDELYRVADVLRKGRLKIPVEFLMDEFANIVLPDDFSKLVATMRSRNISVSIIIQNITQLQALYKDYWQSIIGNCDIMLYLGGNEKEVHKYISELLDKETIVVKNSSLNKGRSGGSSNSYQYTGRDLMTPGEVRELPDDESILFIRGRNPVIDKKISPKEIPNYKWNPRFGGKIYEHGKCDRLMKWRDLDEKFNNDNEYVIFSDEDAEEILKAGA